MIGRKLNNRYEIREHLGDGSTATVYKAFDERLGRDVAIKLLLPHVRETTRKRFFQEATSAAQLNHPNIMAIFDIDQEGERHFLVVEYVDGASLADYVPSAPELVVRLGRQIALALQYAHERHIIHRDIKPANIKVTPEGQIKIMDLGLALPREAKRVTASGMVIGTPAYLSPEQAQGLKLDHRTDIYSLGIVLYEMATGQLPFNADDIGALLLQQVKQPPPPPRLMVADLPVALESVILKALEKNPVRRFQTCNTLAEALEAAIPNTDETPTLSARPNWTDTNIKVTPEGQIKIMDLGLALPREAKRVTASGMVIGTPAYLSPEQAQGLKLDHRTDIYSLGIVLYEMATGQLPFNADDIGALLLQQVKQPPPPPRLMVADLPVALESVILKALEKNPVRRFQTCNTLAEALEAAIPNTDETPTLSARPNWTDTMQAGPIHDVTRRNKRALRVILADDHTLLRKSLAGLLEQKEGFVVVAEAADGESALQQTLAILPDLLLLDLNMPGKGGLDILPDVRAKAPQVKVLVLTGRDEDSYIVRALRAGAHGYILKSSEENDLMDAISRVMQGQLVLGRGVAEKIVTGVLAPTTGHDKLNDTEQQILLYVAAGYENDVIAKKMEKSMSETIEALAHAMDKLGAKDRHAAALKALRNGDIMLDDLHNLSQ